MRKIDRRDLAVALLVALAATGQPAAAESIDTPGCAFSVGPVDDLRPDTGSLGNANGQRLEGSATASLSEGLAAMPGYQETPTALQLKIELLKAYVQGLSSLKTAQLVVRVSYAHGQTPLETRVYRGSHGSTNWFNSESEWRSTFAEARQDLLRQIAGDLDRLCPPTPTVAAKP